MSREEETGRGGREQADITLELWVMYFVHGEASFSKTASRCDEEEKIKIGFPLRGLAGSIEEWMVWCGQFVMALPPSSSGKSVVSYWWIMLDIFLLSTRVLYQNFSLKFSNPFYYNVFIHDNWKACKINFYFNLLFSN